MECMPGTIGLLTLAATIVVASGTALTLAAVPYIRERRRTFERAAFLRAQLLHQLETLPLYFQERDRSLSIEQRDILDEFASLVQQTHLLEMDEWDSLLRVQATLLTARNRASYSKREARIAQQLIQHAKAALAFHGAEQSQRISWKSLFTGMLRRRTQNELPVDRSLKLRQTAG
jgi:hypothetical protein